MKKITEQMLSPDEAAALLGCSVMTLRRAVRAGKVPFVRLGPRTVRFSPSALRQLAAMPAASASPDEAA